MDTPGHVLFICSTYPARKDARSGIFFRDQVMALRSAGYRVGVLVVNGISPDDFLLRRNADPLFEQDEGVPLFRAVRLPLPVRKHDARFHLWTITMPLVWLYRRYCRQFGRPDILHAQNFFYAGLAGLRIKQKSGLPLILTEHSSVFLREALSARRVHLFQRAIPHFDHTVAVSHALAEKMMQIAPEMQTEVIGNFVDTDLFKPLGNRPKSDFVFFIAATFDANKCVGDAMQAFSSGFKDIPNAELWICGSGPQESNLHAYVAGSGMVDRIRFFARADREELVRLFAQADVVLSTSRRETFGLTLLEAMACGKPVIATRSGGPQDFVNPQVGKLVDVGDIPGLSTAMREMYRDFDKYDSEKIRAYVKNHYSQKKFVGRLKNLYKPYY